MKLKNKAKKHYISKCCNKCGNIFITNHKKKISCNKCVHKVYYEKNSEKLKSRMKKRREANPEKYRAIGREWYRENPEKIIAHRKKGRKKANINSKVRREKFYSEGWKTAVVGCSFISTCGYVWLYFKNYYINIPEHRYIMMKHLGRSLKKWEKVHHKDRNRQNNNIENLELIPGAHHDEHSHYKTIITQQQKEIERLRRLIPTT